MYTNRPAGPMDGRTFTCSSKGYLEEICVPSYAYRAGPVTRRRHEGFSEEANS